MGVEMRLATDGYYSRYMNSKPLSSRLSRVQPLFTAIEGNTEKGRGGDGTSGPDPQKLQTVFPSGIYKAAAGNPLAYIYHDPIFPC